MSKLREVEFAVSASWIIPIVPRNRVFTDCSLVIDRGKIIDICPTVGLTNRFAPAKTVDLPGQVLLPGLINCHGHAAMVLMRGLADDKPLMSWLNDHIWPAEQKWVGEKFVRDGTTLAIAEMLLSGTTCFADMYFYPDEVAATAFDMGMRAQVNFPVFDFPTAWAGNADEYISKGLALHDSYRSIDLITIGFGPHAPYTVSDAPLKKIAMYAAELQAPIHIHVHETAHEVAESQKAHDLRPIARLAELGVLGPSTQCVHMTQVSDEDIDCLVETGASVVHCPHSNLKLASGNCPVQKLIDSNINVCLGTDGAASNNDLDLFSEAQTAALIGKAVADSATAVSAMSALEMATINGARAMGLEEKIGSLEPGKLADFIAIDLNDISYMPMYDVISQLVYTNVGRRVSHVWIDGKPLVKNHALVGHNLAELFELARYWQQKLTV